MTLRLLAQFFHPNIITIVTPARGTRYTFFRVIFFPERFTVVLVAESFMKYGDCVAISKQLIDAIKEYHHLHSTVTAIEIQMPPINDRAIYESITDGLSPEHTVAGIIHAMQPRNRVAKRLRPLADQQSLLRHTISKAVNSIKSIECVNEADCSLLSALIDDPMAMPIAAIKARLRHINKNVKGHQERDLNASTPKGRQIVRAEPSETAFAAYRIARETGCKQQAVAVGLTKKLGRPISQGQVSKWLKEVKDWMEAGNALPGIDELRHKPRSIDPSVIDMGKRSNTLTTRQRQHRDSDNDDVSH